MDLEQPRMKFQQQKWRGFKVSNSKRYDPTTEIEVYISCESGDWTKKNNKHGNLGKNNSQTCGIDPRQIEISPARWSEFSVLRLVLECGCPGCLPPNEQWVWPAQNGCWTGAGGFTSLERWSHRKTWQGQPTWIRLVPQKWIINGNHAPKWEDNNKG